MMYGPGYGYGYGMMGGSWLGGLLMIVLGVLVLIGFVLLVVWAARASSRHDRGMMTGQMPHGPAGHDEAVSIAKKRLASGEITKEQYDEIIRTLGG